MDIVTRLLTLPVTGPIDGVLWIAKTIKERAEAEYFNEGAVRSRLLELELKLDMGEITEDEYQAAEDQLLELLTEIRKRLRAEQTS